ncbi:acyl-CoA dehydrogenase [Nocardioides psychrotolerans]|uniref:Acyl-CoA dehydrogenase n=1 Tax=Nocardioides psychrotolerans TaxID=1005945 RepID=A0A1I3JS87_9ACTN|nr:acyl-CoA dehydrogenase family protein [Nocardioides psychrotolerans]GEP38288.1 acyl-CoA dehydrogenase [Nocardioides psychrotolerans]SFI62878.1 hypothetical protein SAMN05216561_1114 [Nocardioides psychrotolerans]
MTERQDVLLTFHRDPVPVLDLVHAVLHAVPATAGPLEPLGHGLTDGVPQPGAGETMERWEVLATLGAHDLQVARAAEPHLDALAILDEAGRSDLTGPELRWGVFAAEGPGLRLTAEQHDDDTWTLSGTKPWCSLGSQLERALVTAWVDEERRGMFAVDLTDPRVTPAGTGQSWAPSGLRDIPSGSLAFDAVDARPVGDPGWYLRRDGFGWGGIGVAAVWYGGAVAVHRRMLRQAGGRALDQVGLAHLGAADACLHGARAVLAESAAAVDAGLVTGPAGRVAALRVRQVVADAVEAVLLHAAHALGPAPLVEAEHARRVADLQLYVRQHHAERDAAALGRALTEPTEATR